MRCANMMEETRRGVASSRSVDTKRKCLGRVDTSQRPFGRVNECWLDSREGKRDSTSGEFRHESSTRIESLVVAKSLKRVYTIG